MADEDDDLPASSAEADRAAREAEREAPPLTSDEGAGDDDQADDREAEGGEQDDEGSSPEAAAPAEQDADEDDDAGTSPEAAPDEASDDGWTDEERAVRAQYKDDPRELVRALLHTKTHSLGQHKTIEELKGKLTEAQQGRGGAAPGGPSPTEQPAPAPSPSPDSGPPDVQRARRTLDAMADDYDAAEKAIADNTTKISEQRTALTKLDGRIEGFEEELKDPNVSDIRRDEIASAMGKLTSQKDRIESTITRLETVQTRLEVENISRASQHAALKERVAHREEQIRASDRVKASERKDFEEREKTERQNLDTAISHAIAELKVAKEDRSGFTEAMLIAANGHPGDIKDLRKFFVDQGQRHLRIFGGVRARNAASYGEQKRKDASQPAPRGPAAHAAAKTDRPLTSKEADKLARESSKRIPLQ